MPKSLALAMAMRKGARSARCMRWREAGRPQSQLAYPYNAAIGKELRPLLNLLV